MEVVWGEREKLVYRRRGKDKKELGARKGEGYERKEKERKEERGKRSGLEVWENF